MSLHYLVKLETLTAYMLPLSCYRKKLQNLSHLITDLELSTTPLANGCCDDDITQLGPLSSQSLFQFVEISNAYFVHLLLQ